MSERHEDQRSERRPVIRSEAMSVTMRATRTQARSDTADDLETRLAATIPQLMRHLLANARRAPAWRNFTHQQYNVLRIINVHGPIGQAEIARRLLVSAPVLTRLVRGLVDLQLVARSQDPADGRAVRLVLTPTGRRRSTAMRKGLLAAAAQLIEPLPTERRAAVAAALDELQVLLPDRASTR